MSAPEDFMVIIGGGDGESIVYIAGDIDLDARDQLVDALTKASSTSQRLVIDLSQTTFIDSTGLKALVDVWRYREPRGLEVLLREPPPMVMHVLKIAGLAELIPIDLTNRPTP